MDWKAEPDRTPTSPPRTDRTSGFTLVEVLVALLLIAVISVLISRILQGGLRVQSIQQEQQRLLQLSAGERALQFSGELEEDVVTLEPAEEEE